MKTDKTKVKIDKTTVKVDKTTVKVDKTTVKTDKTTVKIDKTKVKVDKTKVNFVCFCCLTSHVNSYGHCGTVSSLNHTFSWAGLSKRLTSNLCTYFRL